DIYKPARKNASDREVMWAGRIVVAVICVVAFFIAWLGNKSIMDLVENAWGAFGAAFGPVILLSLYWKRLNYAGAISGIIAGFVTDIAYVIARGNMILTKEDAIITGNLGELYEIIPGFLVGLIVCVIVTKLTKAPEKEVEEVFDQGVELLSKED
nr:sodium:proline symporter [Lachnospiraceae bacterium]